MRRLQEFSDSYPLAQASDFIFYFVVFFPPSPLFFCTVVGISCHACDSLLRHLGATPCWGVGGGGGHPPDLDALIPPRLTCSTRHRFSRAPPSTPPLRRRVLMANGFLKHSVASHLKECHSRERGDAFCGVSGFPTEMYNLLLMGSTAK